MSVFSSTPSLPFVTVEPAAMVTSRSFPPLRVRVPVEPVLSSVPPTMRVSILTLEPFSERMVPLLITSGELALK